MSFSNTFLRIFKSVLPAPFTIAVVLTVLTWCLSFFLGDYPTSSWVDRSIELAKSWELGVWNNGLMVFAVQMMLMLVLGHVLALTKSVNRLIQLALVSCTNNAKSAALVTFLTIIIGLFNWGLGLVFGAIFARKIAEKASTENWKINYPLIGACGYVGLMVWHGGLSGSSLTKVAEEGHLQNFMKGIYSADQIAGLPLHITFSETVFSGMNLCVTLLLLAVVPTVMYFIGKNDEGEIISLKASHREHQVSNVLLGAERLDHSSWLGVGFGLVVLFVAGLKMFGNPTGGFLSFFTPNNINLTLLGLGLLLHSKFSSFLHALEDAIGGVSGILIQFPLYFGIMGMMKGSGLINSFSEFMVSISSETTFPIFTFISAGLVNIFVPSGGGQWAVQGPIIVQAAQEIGVSLPKSVMALAYGDQLTNMLQPFWALPLLGITGLKAKEILPYSLILFLTGGAIYLIGLLIF